MTAIWSAWLQKIPNTLYLRLNSKDKSILIWWLYEAHDFRKYLIPNTCDWMQKTKIILGQKHGILMKCVVQCSPEAQKPKTFRTAAFHTQKESDKVLEYTSRVIIKTVGLSEWKKRKKIDPLQNWFFVINYHHWTGLWWFGPFLASQGHLGGLGGLCGV